MFEGTGHSLFKRELERAPPEFKLCSIFGAISGGKLRASSLAQVQGHLRELPDRQLLRILFPWSGFQSRAWKLCVARDGVPGSHHPQKARYQLVFSRGFRSKRLNETTRILWRKRELRTSREITVGHLQGEGPAQRKVGQVSSSQDVACLSFLLLSFALFVSRKLSF